MQSESIIVLVAAAVSIALLLLLRSVKSKLYNHSAGIGLVLICFPVSLAGFSDLQWWLAITLAVVGALLWVTDFFGKI